MLIPDFPKNLIDSSFMSAMIFLLESYRRKMNENKIKKKTWIACPQIMLLQGSENPTKHWVFWHKHESKGVHFELDKNDREKSRSRKIRKSFFAAILMIENQYERNYFQILCGELYLFRFIGQSHQNICNDKD